MITHVHIKQFLYTVAIIIGTLLVFRQCSPTPSAKPIIDRIETAIDAYKPVADSLTSEVAKWEKTAKERSDLLAKSQARVRMWQLIANDKANGYVSSATADNIPDNDTTPSWQKIAIELAGSADTAINNCNEVVAAKDSVIATQAAEITLRDGLIGELKTGVYDLSDLNKQLAKSAKRTKRGQWLWRTTAVVATLVAVFK